MSGSSFGDGIFQGLPKVGHCLCDHVPEPQATRGFEVRSQYSLYLLSLFLWAVSMKSIYFVHDSLPSIPKIYPMPEM